MAGASSAMHSLTSAAVLGEPAACSDRKIDGPMRAADVAWLQPNVSRALRLQSTINAAIRLQSQSPKGQPSVSKR